MKSATKMKKIQVRRAGDIKLTSAAAACTPPYVVNV